MVKNELFKHIGDTRAELVHTTGGMSATVVPSGEVPAEIRGMSNEEKMSSDSLYAQVVSLSPKCHCDDMDVTSARITAV